jgi:hypothetical protein
MPRMKSRKHCSSGCLTGGHKTWGECVRGKALQLTPNLSETNVQKAWDRELDSYESARAQGVEPRGTKQHHIDEAMKISDATGVAFEA